MPLPDLIEIVPLSKPVRAEITVPGSKSITNRALILAALADGETTLRGALWSEDTQVMVEALHTLGFEVRVEPDPAEFCNRTITVRGLGGRIPNAGTAEEPLELFVGNAGTAARFLAAFVCLGRGVYRLHGVARMHERPQAALFTALRHLGYRVESEVGNDKLPARVFGAEPCLVRSSRGNEAHPGADPERSQSLLTSAATKRVCEVSVEESSQFASALLLCAESGGWTVFVRGANAEEMPYVEMTRTLVEVFPKRSGVFQIEPDASSGSYIWQVGWFLKPFFGQVVPDTSTGIHRFGTAFLPATRDLKRVLPVTVREWPESGLQVDGNFPRYLPLPEAVSRLSSLGDSIMTAIAAAPLAEKCVRFTDLGRLRLQECERVVALRTELTKCGAEVFEEGDTLTVFPSQLHGAEIETYNDHRMAMCFAILGLKVPGIKLQNPACVKKTFPNFFQKLAAPPPDGLGAEIRDARTGRRLAMEELFAD